MPTAMINPAPSLEEAVGSRQTPRQTNRPKNEKFSSENRVEGLAPQAFVSVIIQMAQELNLTPKQTAEFLEKYAADFADIRDFAGWEKKNGSAAPEISAERAPLDQLKTLLRSALKDPAWTPAAVPGRAQEMPAGQTADSAAQSTSAPRTLPENAENPHPLPPSQRTEEGSFPPVRFQGPSTQSPEPFQGGKGGGSIEPEIVASLAREPPVQTTALAPETGGGDMGADSAVSGSRPPVPPSEAPTVEIAKTPPVSENELLDQVVERARMHRQVGHSEIRIDLKPESLGKLTMHLSLDQQTMTVKILTETPQVRDMIETNLPQLKTELQNQGLKIESVHVMLAQDSRHHGYHGKGGTWFSRGQEPSGEGRGSSVSALPAGDASIPAPGVKLPSRVDYFA